MELPARPVWAQMILSSPTTQAWPICTRLSIFAPRSHAGLAHGGAIDRGQALNLDVVLNDRDARLHDLVMRSVGPFGETEPIAAHHHAVLQDHAIADAADTRAPPRANEP